MTKLFRWSLVIVCAICVVAFGNIALADNDNEEKEFDFRVPVADGSFVITQLPGGIYSHSVNSWRCPGGLCAEAYDIAKAGGGGVTPNGQVVAAEEGEVVFAAYSGGWGNYVIIDHGEDVYTIYAHLDGLAVRKGDDVEKGELLGPIGNTGASTGPHLHFSFFDGHPQSGGRPMKAREHIDLEEEIYVTIKAKLSSAIGGIAEDARDIAKEAKDFFVGFLDLFEPDEYGWNKDIIIPDEPDVEVGEIDYEPISKFVADLYVRALGIGGLIAMILIVYGGVRYTMSGSNPAIKADAKEWIVSALLGLLLLFSAYMLLQFISPCLVGSC
jgi:hypothetical protein